MISIWKLAAIDMALHGPKLILAEFGLAVGLAGFAGIAGLLHGRGHSSWTWYFLSVALNYSVLLGYSLSLLRGERWAALAEPEIHDRPSLIRYPKQQLWLLAPLVVPLAALRQELGRRA